MKGKRTSGSAKKGSGKAKSSDSSQLRGNIAAIQKLVQTVQPTPTPTSSSNLPPITTKNPSPISSSSTKSPSPSPSKNSPKPNSPEIDVSNIKEPASSQGEQPRSTGEFLDTEGGKEDEEVRSEEEDLKIIGVTEETPKPLIRSRVTRSSLKKIDEVELEEQSTYSVTGTKRKRTTRKSVKGMESPSVGTSDLESRVVLSGCRTEVGYFDEIALSYVKELLEFQGWLSLFDVCDANIDGVRKFYVNLKQLLDRSLSSIVNDIEVHVSVASLAGLLNIPRDGFEEYSGDGWPTLIGVSPDEIHDFVFGGKVPKKGGTFKTGGLKEPVMLVLHSLCNKMFLPRAQGRGFVRIMEMVLIYLLMTKIKINLPSLMINHMMNCYNSSHHSLPYGSYITKLLTKNNVSLSGSTAPVIVFTKGILKQKGLIFCDGVLKFREEEPAEPPKHAKKKLKAEEPAGQKGILMRLEKQEERMSVVGDKLDKLISLVEGLSTSFILRMSKLEKQIASSSGVEKAPAEENQQADQQKSDNKEEENQGDADEEANTDEEEEDDENDDE